MKHKKLIISLTVIVVIIVGGLIGGSLYMIDYSLRPENRGKDLAGSEAYMRETYPQINGWLGECSTEVMGVEDLHLLGK